jgi:uncharacterized alkaline shock family protein YloU
VEGRASISTDVLASYAADAARDVQGVRGLVDGHLPRQRPVRVLDEEAGLRVELHLTVERGVSIPEVGRAVQRRVREYLAEMADVEAAGIDVFVDGLAA